MVSFSSFTGKGGINMQDLNKMEQGLKIRLIDPREIVIPSDRQREDLGDRRELIESISKVGQLINPIVVTYTEYEGKRQYVLIAGHRRLLSVLDLEWKLVNVSLWDNLSEDERYTIELEENIGRKDLEWHEEAKAVAELQRRKQLEVEGSLDRKGRGTEKWKPHTIWTMQDTADLLNVTKAKVSLDCKLAKALEKDDSLKNLTKTQALSRVKREEINRIRKELAKRASLETQEGIIHGSCEEVLKTLPNEIIDLAILDPPYGVDVHEVLDDTASMKEEEKFSDSVEDYKIILTIRDELFRIISPGAHLYIFCAIENFREIRDFYAEKFIVRRVPLIWSKVYGGKNMSTQYQWGNAWEPIIFCSKGVRSFNKTPSLYPSRGDVLTYARVSGTAKVHETEKPTELLKSLIEVSSDPDDLVLDCFAGSGSTGVAAISIGRRALLIEKLLHNVETIKARIQEVLDKKLIPTEEETADGLVGEEDSGTDSGENDNSET